MPLVTIFIPAWNCAPFIGEAIESVLQQVFADWQLFVIDDASDDDTYNRANAFALMDNRIRVIRNNHNLGMVGNWNKGLSLCDTPFCVKLDGDDRWHPEFLQQSLSVMLHNPDIGLVFTNYLNIDASGQYLHNSTPELPSFAKNKRLFCVDLVKMGPDKMLQFPILRQGVSLIRMRAINEVGWYRYLASRRTEASSDTEFYFRMGAHFPIYVLDKPLYEYRVHNESISARDAVEELQALKLKEVKTAIIQYYQSIGAFGFFKYLFYLRQIRKYYGLYNIAHYRKRSAYLKMLYALVGQVAIFPFFTYSYYMKCIWQKVTSHNVTA